MEKHVSGIIVLVAVFALLIGGLVGYNMGEAETIYTEKIVNRTISVDNIVEVQAPSQLDLAVAEFLEAVEDEEDEAGNDVNVLGSYDFDEIEVSRIYDEYAVQYDDEVTTVDFKIKLRFDEDGEASEKKTYNVTVIFDEDEDTEVTAILA